MFNILLAMICAVSLNAAPIDWTSFECEADSAIERAAHRFDCGPAHDCPQNRWFTLAELDNLIERNHRLFTKKHALKIKSLASRKRTDALLESYQANERLESMVQDKQFKLLLELRDRVDSLEAILKDIQRRTE